MCLFGINRTIKVAKCAIFGWGRIILIAQIWLFDSIDWRFDLIISMAKMSIF